MFRKRIDLNITRETKGSRNRKWKINRYRKVTTDNQSRGLEHVMLWTALFSLDLSSKVHVGRWMS